MSGQFDIGDVSPLHYFVAVSLAFGLLFGLTTPDDDSGFALLVIFQWVLQSLGAVLVIIGCQVLLAKLPGYSSTSKWFQLIASGLLGALLITPLLSLLDQWTDTDQLVGELDLLSRWLNEFIGAAPAIVAAWIAMNLPFTLGYRFSATSPTVATIPEPIVEEETHSSSILERLPNEKRGSVIYMEAELHYVKVVTDRGASLVLYSLKDAANELGNEIGMLCHRSFWVSFDAITSFKKQGRQGLLTMNDGSTVPVSRANVVKVDEALKNFRT